MIKPLKDYLVLEIEKDEVSKGGVFLPETAAEKNISIGIIVEVGEGRSVLGKNIPIPVKKGDKVIFSKYAPNKVEIEGKTYLMAKEDDIMAIIE